MHTDNGTRKVICICLNLLFHEIEIRYRAGIVKLNCIGIETDKLYLAGNETEIRISKDFLISLVTCSQTVMITQQSHVWNLQFLKIVTGPLELTGSPKVGKVSTMNHEIEGITAAIDIINLTLQIIQPLV